MRSDGKMCKVVPGPTTRLRYHLKKNISETWALWRTRSYVPRRFSHFKPVYVNGIKFTASDSEMGIFFYPCIEDVSGSIGQIFILISKRAIYESLDENLKKKSK